MQQQSEIQPTTHTSPTPEKIPSSYSDEGYALTKRFEGLRLSAYQDQSGIWTIGYGHTGPDVHQGLTITIAQADALLRSDIACAVACVHRAVTTRISQCHFDALVDFVFNLGCSRLAGSTLLRHVNADEFELAAPQFLLWDHAGAAVVPGLLARRHAEMAMFRSEDVL